MKDELLQEQAINIAKEITLGVIPRVGSISQPDETGKLAGQVFAAVYKQVLSALKEQK